MNFKIVNENCFLYPLKENWNVYQTDDNNGKTILTLSFHEDLRPTAKQYNWLCSLCQQLEKDKKSYSFMFESKEDWKGTRKNWKVLMKKGGFHCVSPTLVKLFTFCFLRALLQWKNIFLLKNYVLIELLRLLIFWKFVELLQVCIFLISLFHFHSILYS